MVASYSYLASCASSYNNNSYDLQLHVVVYNGTSEEETLDY